MQGREFKLRYRVVHLQWRARMDTIPDTPVRTKQSAPVVPPREPVVPPREVGDGFQESFKEVPSTNNLEERLENWGSD